MGIKHTFVSAAPEGGDASKVRTSNWNEDHDLSAMVINDVPGLTTALAGKAPAFRGALVRRNAAVAVGAFPQLPVPYDTVSYDTSSFWDAANNRFVVPAGVSRVRLMAGVEISNSATAGSLFVDIRDTAGAAVPAAVSTSRDATSGFSSNIKMAVTPVLAVSPGDTFRVRANMNAYTGITQYLATAQNFFSIEAVS